jgi:hypothetical protein
MNELMKWTSLQKSASKFMPKKFYEIDPFREYCPEEPSYSYSGL